MVARLSDELVTRKIFEKARFMLKTKKGEPQSVLYRLTFPTGCQKNQPLGQTRILLCLCIFLVSSELISLHACVYFTIKSKSICHQPLLRRCRVVRIRYRVKRTEANSRNHCSLLRGALNLPILNYDVEISTMKLKTPP